MNDLNFDEWWAQLQGLAILEGLELVGDQDDYREYFEDGDSPEDTIEIELSYTDDEEEELDTILQQQANGTRWKQ